MMQMLSFPMYNSRGSRVSLEDVLGFIPENTWIWYILDFYGMGCPSPESTMDSFEARIRSSENGIAMTGAELNIFARSLDQTRDLQLVAAKVGKTICRKEIEAMNFCKIEVSIEAIDSSEWLIWTRDTLLHDRIRGQLDD
ncbi:hypothetical protein P5705_09955 [Pseudomonas entomophila]|uniref:hypothetical protein n=1 Tax=Pseudomonas entomophila TaxID=312306 RepID=UPI0024053205|nr:hypothetical protein [Pseudomonas entomophila]MDF9617966.1 hypothetical protein [Pseudomonas entomophila]